MKFNEILYMQVRLTRQAAERWGVSLGDAARTFARHGVPQYIRQAYGVFHLQGDAANLDDIEQFIQTRPQP